MRHRKKIKEKKKRRWEKGEGLFLPNLVGLGLEGEGCPPRLGRPPWESLDPKARLPLLPLYIRRF